MSKYNKIIKLSIIAKYKDTLLIKKINRVSTLNLLSLFLILRRCQSLISLKTFLSVFLGLGEQRFGLTREGDSK